MKKALFCCFCVVFSISLHAQLTYQNLRVEYDSAVTYKNLKIIPIRWKGPGGNDFRALSLADGVKRGKVVITERGTASTENVHWLRVNNTSDQPLFVASGELIAGGRQDRMVARDTILIPTGHDQYIPVMCVEEDRWSRREKKFIYFNYANPTLRKTLDIAKNQVVIWREVNRQLDGNKIVSPSLAYAANRLDKKRSPAVLEYFNFFHTKFQQTDSSIVGIVCMTDNKVIGSDIFANAFLLYGQLDALLYGYIEEAELGGAPVTIRDEKIKKYLDRFLGDEQSQEEYLKTNGKIFRYRGNVIHITAFGD